MNQREAKIAALNIAWQLVGRQNLVGGLVDLPDDEAVKIAKELDKIAQQLFNRMERLKEHKQRWPQSLTKSTGD